MRWSENVSKVVIGKTIPITQCVTALMCREAKFHA